MHARGVTNGVADVRAGVRYAPCGSAEHIAHGFMMNTKTRSVRFTSNGVAMRSSREDFGGCA